MTNRLELTWVDKDRRLLAHDDVSYEWVDPTDWRVGEVRLLHDVDTVGDPSDGNLLIRGDAMHALEALIKTPEYAARYVGKVKLVYIDPPFNTGQTFEHYNDNLEHSVWLTMLRDRLEQIQQLLAPDGTVWVHLDDTEQHRARCVLDEIFGAENFVATVIWEKRYSRSNDASFSVSHDYLAVYRSTPAWSRSGRLERGIDAQYSNPDNDPKGPWRGIPWDAPEERVGLDYPITTATGEVKRPPKGRHWSGTEANWLAVVSDERDYYGKAGSGMPNVKRYLSEMPGLVPHTIWTHEEVGHNDQATKEIKALFPGGSVFATPKPERLLERIIHIGSDPGDIVLDCFGGSGTTAAVAHKMGRRWVTVEQSADTISTFLRPRLEMVVKGEDPGGITTTEVPTGEGLPDGVKPGEAKTAAKALSAFLKAGALHDVEKFDEATVEGVVKVLRDAERINKQTLWEGGGGFAHVEVGPSMFETVDGSVVMAEWAVGGELAEAVAAQLGFEFVPDGPLAGRKGRKRLAVVDGMVTEAVAEHLVGLIGDDETLFVVARSLEPGVEDRVRELRSGSRARKIPRDLAHVGRLPSRLVRLNKKGGGVGG